jgi:hypothetical protein
MLNHMYLSQVSTVPLLVIIYILMFYITIILISESCFSVITIISYSEKMGGGEGCEGFHIYSVSCTKPICSISVLNNLPVK